MKTIKLSLSVSDIDNAIKEIEAYRASLNGKVEQFVKRLSKVGLEVAKAVIQSVPLEDEPGQWSVNVSHASSGSLSSAKIVLEGDKVLFIEFGAGNVHAQPQNPLAKEFGYGAGTYPGQTHVPNPGFWYYYPNGDKERGAVKSYGNKAYMPMYHASEAIALELMHIAKEVFES